MAKKKDLRSHKEIREMFEQSKMKFVMLNNRLFDDFYSKGKVTYRPQLVGKNNDEWLNYTGKIHPYQSYSDNSKFIEATFDERDFILIIIIKF